MLLTRNVLALTALAAALAAPATALADTAGETLIQSRTNGLAPFGPGAINTSTAQQRSVSADGCKIVFLSSADGLASGDNDATRNVYVRDRCAKTTVHVSRRSDGTPQTADAGTATISPDGRYVAFSSTSPLDPSVHIPAGLSAAYRHDLATGQTRLVSRYDGADGAVLGVDPSRALSVADSGKVLFLTQMKADAANDTNVAYDAYARDVAAGTTTLASRTAGTGGSAAGSVHDAIYDGDGAVIFSTPAGIDQVDDTNGSSDVYRAYGAVTQLVSRAPGSTVAMGGSAGAVVAGAAIGWLTSTKAGADQNSDADVYVRVNGATVWGSPRTGGGHPVVSAALGRAGDAVAYTTGAPVVAGDTNNAPDVFVHDVSLGTTMIASRPDGPGGPGADGASGYFTSLSLDGTVIAFDSAARNLPGESDFSRVYARRVLQHANELVSRPDGDGTWTSGANRTTQRHSGEARPDGQMSSDGRYVVFESQSDALTPGDDDRIGNVYVRDNVSDTTRLVGVATDGTAATKAQQRPVISSDGRRVAFITEAALDPARDTNGQTDVYVRDLDANTTTLVSRTGSSAAGGVDVAGNLAIDADGDRVAWTALGRLDGADGNSAADVYVRDLDAATTMLASRGTDGAVGGTAPSLDAAGDTVAFLTQAAVAGDDGNGTFDIYLRELATDTTELGSSEHEGAGAGQAGAHGASLSADGRRLAFISQGLGLHPDGVGPANKAFVRDRDANTTRPLANSAGNGAGEHALGVSLSDDGTHVAFATGARLSPADPDSTSDVYVHELASGTNILASRADGTGGEKADQAATAPSVNGNGACVAFTSASGRLVPGTYAGGDFEQVYRRVVKGECVDESVPETELDGDDPTAPITDSTPQFAFSSPEAGAWFECRVDGGEWVACDTPHAIAEVEDDEHTFAVRARDAGGNVDATPAERTFTVDTSGPAAVITAVEADRDGTAVVTFEPGDDAVATTCAIDGVDQGDCTSPWTVSDLTAGPHIAAVTAHDALGNPGPVVEQAFTVPAKPKPQSGGGSSSGGGGSSSGGGSSDPAPPAPEPAPAPAPAPVPAASAPSTAPVAPRSAPAPRRARLAARTVNVTRKGTATIRLACAATGCRGTAVLRARIGRRTVVLGHRHYRFGAGTTAKVAIRISAAGRRALVRMGRLKATVQLAGTSRAQVTLRRG